MLMRALQLVEDRKLEIVELPEPGEPGIGEVQLSIKAVALNHIDGICKAQNAACYWG
jgi:alcohol dehydrogenase